MISAPSLLRPGLAAAARTSTLLAVKPASSPSSLGMRASPFALAPCPHARFFSVSPVSSISSTITRAQQTGSSVNRDAAVDAAAAASIAKKASASTSTTTVPLDWNTFFQLRKTRRRIQMVFSGVGGIVGGLAGGMFLGSGVAEPLLGQVPLDPFVTLGLMTFGFSALGWLVGPSMGNAVFYAWKRQFRTQMTTKEVQFFARIKKNRVDPTNSSAGNPVPDFYGEKISSVAGYRQWLKDQRAFNKKRTTFV